MAKKGFTLIEIIIYVGLAAIVLNVSVYFIWQMMESKVKTVAYGEIESNLNFVLEKISFEAQKAKSLEVPTNPGEEVKDLLLVDPDGQKVHFYLDNGTMMVERENSKLPLTSVRVNVNELIFQNLSAVQPATFQIKIKMGYRSEDLKINKIELEGQETINLRDNLLVP